MDIRQLDKNDWQSWRSLRLEALLNAPEAFFSSYDDVRTWPDDKFMTIMQDNTIYGAFDGDNLIGSMAMGVVEGLQRQHQGIVWGVYVKPQYRGQKIGDALLEAIIAQAKTIVMQLQLSAHTENHGALRLYQRHGFEVYGVEPHAIKVGNRFYDECLMMLIFDRLETP